MIRRWLRLLIKGDGGSNEPEGAEMAGMKAVQAKWYTNQHPYKRESIAGFLTALQYIPIVPQHIVPVPMRYRNALYRAEYLLSALLFVWYPTLGRQVSRRW